MSTKDRVYAWDEGRPTKPDVDALMMAYPDLATGDLLDYEQVASIIGSDPKSSRFRTVTTVWRKRMQDKGVILECRKSEAFYVATADEVAALTYGVINGMGAKARRHRRKLARVPTDTEDQRSTVNHQGLLMRRIEDDAKRHRMNVLPSTEVQPAVRVDPRLIGKSQP
jgi:hypothetical protein